MKNKKLCLRLISLAAVIIMLLSVPSMSVLAYQLPQPEKVKGTSAIIMDTDTDRVLYEYNADMEIVPASTTKVLTALLVIEACERGDIHLDDNVTTTQSVIDGVMWDASRVSPYIIDGEKMSVRDYLHCVLMESDCLACDVLAKYVSGSVEAFVEEMNKRATELSCTDFCFKNTHGYPVDGHYATTRDLALITQEAIKHPDFCEIFGALKHDIAKTNMNSARKLYNSDWMLYDPEKITSKYTKYFYEYTLGGKTGTSKASGHCLTSYAKKDGTTLICVITGAEIAEKEDGSSDKQSFSESTRLYKWAYDNWKMQTVLSSGDIICQQPIEGGKEESVNLYITEDFKALLPVGISASDLTLKPVLNNEIVEAPVNAFSQLGKVEIYLNDEFLGSYNIASETGVEKSGPGAVAVGVCVAGVMMILGASGWLVYNSRKKGMKVPAYSIKRNGSDRAVRYSSGYLNNEQHQDYTGYRSRIPEGSHRRNTTRVRTKQYDYEDEYDPYDSDDVE